MERSEIRGRLAAIPDCAEFILGHAEGVTRGLHPGYDVVSPAAPRPR